MSFMRKSTSHKTLSQIEKAMGPCLVPSDRLQHSSIALTQPSAIVQPTSEEQVADLVRLSRDGDVMLLPYGAGHQILDIRDPHDTRPIVGVSTRHLNKYLGYSQDDLTITVQSGVTLAELDELTSTFGQHLPLDAPFNETATVGGLVATNAWGPRRMRYGTTADYVLGGALVMADGTIVKSGHKRIKNIAGYDLHKLLVGSYGAIGIVTEVTLKLKPTPEDFRLVEILAENIEEATYLIGQLIRGNTRPAMIVLLNPLGALDLGHTLSPDSLLLCVGYEDTTEAVEWQLTHLHVTLGDRIILLDTADSLEEFKKLVDWPTREGPVVFEVSVLDQRCEALVDYCRAQDWAALAHVGNGVVLMRSAQPLTTESLNALCSRAGAGCTIKFTRLPVGANVPHWFGAFPQQQWLREVKEQFDPHHIFPFPGFLR